MPTVVFDLDGTISNPEHRVHLLTQDPPNWKEFYEMCDKDKPNPHVIMILKALKQAGKRIVILTGRSIAVESKTVAWLASGGIPFDELHMRKENDFRPGGVLKTEWVNAMKEKPILAFEDTVEDANAFMNLGIPAIIVGKAAFGEFSRMVYRVEEFHTKTFGTFLFGTISDLRKFAEEKNIEGWNSNPDTVSILRKNGYNVVRIL